MLNHRSVTRQLKVMKFNHARYSVSADDDSSSSENSDSHPQKGRPHQTQLLRKRNISQSSSLFSDSDHIPLAELRTRLREQKFSNDLLLQNERNCQNTLLSETSSDPSEQTKYNSSRNKTSETSVDEGSQITVNLIQTQLLTSEKVRTQTI